MEWWLGLILALVALVAIAASVRWWPPGVWPRRPVDERPEPTPQEIADAVRRAIQPPPTAEEVAQAVVAALPPPQPVPTAEEIGKAVAEVMRRPEQPASPQEGGEGEALASPRERALYLARLRRRCCNGS